MKKVIALILSLTIVLTLAGCGKTTGGGDPVVGGGLPVAGGADMPTVGNDEIIETEQAQPATYETETVSFHDKTFNKSDLSAETLEWLEHYNTLSPEEQLAISRIPNDLYELGGYGEAENAETDGPAE